jgi:hypothetical protein
MNGFESSQHLQRYLDVIPTFRRSVILASVAAVLISLCYPLTPIDLDLISGTLMSAMYAAFAMTQLYSILGRFKVEKLWRIIWMILVGVQPLILHNAALGMSETPFIGFLLFSFNGYLIWRQERRNSGIMMAAIGAWLAIYCRYEALAWTAVMAVGISWNWLFSRGKTSPEKLEADLLSFLVPPAYGFMFWVFLNWTIMGIPSTSWWVRGLPRILPILPRLLVRINSGITP